MTEYKVWAFARSAAPNLPALEEQLADVMREADRRGYIIVNSCMEQKYGTEFWRPALFAMLTAVQQGRVNAIMVQSLDRLSHDITTLYRIWSSTRKKLHGFGNSFIRLSKKAPADMLWLKC